MTLNRTFKWLVLTSSLCSNLVMGADTRRVKTRSIMSDIYLILQDILPTSIDQQAFHDLKNRSHLQRQARKLAKNARHLEQHVMANEPALSYVAHSMEQDAVDISQRLQEGRLEEARFVLHNITENCVSCHTKFDAQADFPGSKDFFKKVNINHLTLSDRGRLQIAMRQFDQAMNSMEGLFRDGNTAPADLYFQEAFTDYLKVTLQVRRDLDRAQKTLTTFLKRRDTPAFVADHVQDWIAALADIHRHKWLSTKSLQTARTLVAKAQQQMDYPRDRDGLVYLITASGVLHAYMSDSKIKKSTAETSECYYLLGLIESVIGRSFWVSQSEFFLESAIRTDPKSNHARKAFTLLEEHMILDYSGSSGLHMPLNVKQRLQELRKLISAG